MSDASNDDVFPSAEQDAEAAARARPSLQSRSESYRLAYMDQDFLLRSDLRPVRLQLELLKAELLLAEHGIDSTVVVFGSARIPDRAAARQRLDQAQDLHRQAPTPDAERQLRIARSVADKTRYYDEARRFARLVSEDHPERNRRCVVVTGGGPGIMEAANRGARDAGAPSVGLNIVLPVEQQPNPYITPELCFQFHYFALRKMHFLMRACALAAFPGGFGTFDEVFETLTLIQTGRIRPIPALLFGEAYWRKVVDFEAMVDEGTIARQDLDLFSYVETAEAGWEAVRRHPGPWA